LRRTVNLQIPDAKHPEWQGMPENPAFCGRLAWARLQRFGVAQWHDTPPTMRACGLNGQILPIGKEKHPRQANAGVLVKSFCGVTSKSVKKQCASPRQLDMSSLEAASLRACRTATVIRFVKFSVCFCHL
jgi:hypothetical protein